MKSKLLAASVLCLIGISAAAADFARPGEGGGRLGQGQGMPGQGPSRPQPGPAMPAPGPIRPQPTPFRPSPRPVVRPQPAPFRPAPAPFRPDPIRGGDWNRDEQVTCQSWSNAPAECYVGDIHSASIVQQLSHASHNGGSCDYGRDWSYDRDTIYVNNGCRAIFEVQKF